MPELLVLQVHKEPAFGQHLSANLAVSEFESRMSYASQALDLSAILEAPNSLDLSMIFPRIVQ
jgi:hypothetical protein